MEENRLTIKDSSIAFVFSFIICQLVVIIFGAVLLFASSMFGIQNIDVFLKSAVGILVMNSVMYLTMLLLFFFFNKNKNNNVFTKPSAKKICIYVLIAYASFLSLYPIVNCVDKLLYYCGIPTANLTYPLNTTNYIISLISMVILPAFCEELLFRGIITMGLSNGGKTFAVIFSSLMFAIYHMAIGQTVYPVLFGLLLATVMLKENNIIYCIAMHLANNFIALTLNALNISLVFNHWTYILMAICLAIVYICFIIFLIKKQKWNKENNVFSNNDKKFLIISILIMLIFWIICNINR